VCQLGDGLTSAQLLRRARMEHRHEGKLAGLELEKAWWWTQDLGWDGVREGGAAGGGSATRE